MSSEEKPPVFPDESVSTTEMFVFAQSYNFLRIMSGMEGLSYSSDGPLQTQTQEVEPYVQEEESEVDIEDEDSDEEPMNPEDIVVQI